MKVQAYITNCCSQLMLEDKCLGLEFIPDMFNNEWNFKVVSPDKSNIHFCLKCYTTIVTKPLRDIDRTKNEDEYKKQLDKNSKAFKQSIYLKANKNEPIKKRIRLSRSSKKSIV